MIEFLKDLLLPSHLAGFTLALGAILLLLPRWRYWGRRFCYLGAAVYLVFSNGLVATMLIRPLEYRYPPLLEAEQYQDIHTLVVLTAYATDDRNMPISSRAGSSAMYRILEVVRLYRDGGIQEIVVSGDPTGSKIMCELLFISGVPEEAVTRDSNSVHTVDSAHNAGRILADRDFILVTSAGHMPRALGVFRNIGLDPVPAPTDFQLPKDIGSASPKFSAFHLSVSDLAIHEYMGLLWYRMTGRTSAYW